MLEEENARNAAASYTLPQLARIVGTRRAQVNSWVNGSPGSHASPILNTELRQGVKGPILGFLDLVESAWVAHFRSLGYSAQTIRRVANKLRAQQNTGRPFAYKNKFLADGKRIFQEVVMEGINGVEQGLVDVMSDNFVMKRVIDQSLMDQIFYVDDLAAEFTPLRNHRNIVVRPNVAFGRPALLRFRVPTEAIRLAYQAEHGDAEAVSQDFEIPVEAVLDAVEFENELEERILH
ncbi:hypothetical protein [Acuticoccus sediminis]|uniref:hypothetical protein n=1 Tax=Acuticoccus sediminis TaxID=2184697 RepID=UPI0011B93F91|nr:hypothetical protein [Acuticoccus sediminis]